MADANETFDAASVRRLLSALGNRLADAGAVAEIALYGGSALLFVTDLRETTRDVDYVRVAGDPSALRGAAAEVSRAAGVGDGWFSDAVEIFKSDDPDYRFLGDFPPERPGLRVFSASPEYVLSIKLMSMRSSLSSSDVSDVWSLLDACGVTAEGEALDLVERFFPGRGLARRNVLVLRDVLDAKERGQPYSREIGW
jgi:hypothetical protein